MQGLGRNATNGTELYQGDVIAYTRKPRRKEERPYPVVGIIAWKDGSYIINSGIVHWDLSPVDKDLELLGNVFEDTDENLAQRVQEKLEPPLNKNIKG